MRNLTFRLSLMLAFLLMASWGWAQDVYQSVGIIGSATPQGWAATTPMKLSDASDPHQWQITLRLYQGALKFRVGDNWDVNWGATAFPTGTAYRNGGDLQIPAESYYTVYFNDATGAYHFEALNPQLYQSMGLIGSATSGSWNSETSMTQDGQDPHVWLLANVSLSQGEVKFRANQDWNYSWGGSSFPAGTAFAGPTNLAVPAGKYNILFNDVTLAYSFEKLDVTSFETVGIIGSATPKDWAASTPMKRLSESDPHRWTLTTYLKEGELKFRANDQWEVNWGSSSFPTGMGTQGGDNIPLAESGYYTITFNDLYGQYQFTRLNPASYATVGIVGDAVSSGWNVSTPMTVGADGHSWSLQNLTLQNGKLKFRADNSWNVNWGGSDFPQGTASLNGPDLPVTAGNYSLSFNDVTGEYFFDLQSGSADGSVTLIPAYPTANEPVTVIYDAGKGVSGLLDASKVYMHSGVVTSDFGGTNWTNVVGNWGQEDGLGEMQPVAGEPGKWQITLPGIRQYYNVAASTPVFRLGMVFRSADGTKVGKSADDGDIFVNVDPGDYARFTAPAAAQVFGVAGEQLLLTAEASAVATSLSLEINDGSGWQTAVQLSNSKTISHAYTFGTATSLQLRVKAQIGAEWVQAEKSLSIVLRKPNTIAALPAGMRSGINYHPQDPSRATLVLLAPGKKFAYAAGDFNSWQIGDASLMNQTPDGEYFWLELQNLEAGKAYAYQYWVEGTLKIGDPYADQVADPYNDSYIPASLYPNPVNYTRTDWGIATVLQTAQQPYQWKFPQVAGGRPANEELVIYELLVRDFLGSHSYKDLADTLGYLKRLGINAIELMPIMEYEGNESWGYNPSYLFAPDKYYGSKNDLKAFIDKAHEMGMVVLLDMVLNHQFGQSPMVRLYFDEATGKPAANSPWFNADATHPFNVGYDFNHESAYTKRYVDDVNRYWLEEYKFDGYRFDLSKGFTQRNNPDDVGAWSAYDQSRVDILSRMAGKIWETDPGAYVILEHLGDNEEEKVLAANGMMLWGNLNHPYNDVINAQTGTNLNWALSSERGWSRKNLVAYMESHDEERLMVRALQEGGRLGEYNIQDLEIALERVKMASAFYYTLPGPKMLWQFGELGYDYSINYNGRVGNKPIPWGEADGLNYHLDEDRQKLYKATAAIIKLVNAYSPVFEEGQFSWTPEGPFRQINISHEEMDVTIVGNFGLTEGSMEADFAHTGTWYDFFTGQPLEVTAGKTNISLAPGEFHIYLDQQVQFPEPGLVEVFTPIVSVKPGIFTVDDQIKITFDAAAANPAGTAGLSAADKVYFRAGLVQAGANSEEVVAFVGSASEDDGIGQMIKVPGDNQKWTIVLRPRAYFGLAAGEGAYRIGMYFRNADGTNEGRARDGGLLFLDIQQQQNVVTVTPSPFTADDQIKVIFDAAQANANGTAGLVDAEKVYMHGGVVLNQTETPSGGDWTNVVGNWGQDDGLGQMQKVAGDNSLWQISLRPRDYFGIDAQTPVYYLAMVFRNAAGTAEGKGPGASDIFIRVAQAALQAPAELQSSVNELLAVQLNWLDNAQGEIAYVVERRAEDEAAFKVIAVLEENALSYTDNQTTDGVTYSYRVKALGAFTPDSDWSNTTLADLPLHAPEQLSATTAGLRELVLSWEDPSAHETAFVLERAEQRGVHMGAYRRHAELSANTTAFVDTQLIPGLRYHYRLKAIDADEASAYSQEVNVRPVEYAQNQLLKKLKLYPNPASTALTISADLVLTAPVQFKLSNMQGFVLKRFEMLPGNKEAKLQLDVSELRDGIYILQYVYQNTSGSLLLQVKH